MHETDIELEADEPEDVAEVQSVDEADAEWETAPEVAVAPQPAAIAEPAAELEPDPDADAEFEPADELERADEPEPLDEVAPADDLEPLDEFEQVDEPEPADTPPLIDAPVSVDEFELADELEPADEAEPVDVADLAADGTEEAVGRADTAEIDDIAAEAEMVAADLAQEFYAEADLVDEKAAASAAPPRDFPLAPPPMAPPEDSTPPQPLPSDPIAPPPPAPSDPIAPPPPAPSDPIAPPPPAPSDPIAPPPPAPSDGIAPPPSFDEWAASGSTSVDDGAPYAGITELGPFDTGYQQSAETEAPRAPQFLPSVTGGTSEAQTSARRVKPVGRSLAGTAVGDAMMLWQLARRRRQSRSPGGGASSVELTLEQTASSESLALIEAAMRHLWAVTVGQGQPSPDVLAVRIGTYGFEVLLERPAQAPPGWRSASGGYVLELPQGVTAHDLAAVGPGPSLCPALVPVGNTFEGPLLLNLQQIGALAISGPSGSVTGLITAIVATLASSPMAGDIDITAVGLDASASNVGWEGVRVERFDSDALNQLLEARPSSGDHLIDDRFSIAFFGPGHDLLIQRAAVAATSPGSNLAVVGATSAVGTRWPWSIHVDGTGTAVVHPVGVTMTAAQAPAPDALAAMDSGPQAGFDPLGPR